MSFGQRETSSYEEALLRVATLSSISPTSSDIESLHGGLILQSLDALGKPSLPEEIVAYLKEQMGIQMTVQAVVEAVGSLDEQDRIQRQDDFKVTVAPRVAAELKDQATTVQNLRHSIVEEWLTEVDQELIAEGKEELAALERIQLEEDLDRYILQLVRYHGAEVALFLYPVLDDVRDILSVDEKTLFQELPSRGDRLREIRSVALPTFVREAKGGRAEYVAGLLHRAALLQILQADAEASALFAEVLEGKTLFLDTNVVFRILGLQGTLLRESSREILAIGEELGHRFSISKMTFNELENLVNRQADWLLRGDDIPPRIR